MEIMFTVLVKVVFTVGLAKLAFQVFFFSYNGSCSGPHHYLSFFRPLKRVPGGWAIFLFLTLSWDIYMWDFTFIVYNSVVLSAPPILLRYDWHHYFNYIGKISPVSSKSPKLGIALILPCFHQSFKQNLLKYVVRLDYFPEKTYCQ